MHLLSSDLIPLLKKMGRVSLFFRFEIFFFDAAHQLSHKIFAAQFSIRNIFLMPHTNFPTYKIIAAQFSRRIFTHYTPVIFPLSFPFLLCGHFPNVPSLFSPLGRCFLIFFGGASTASSPTAKAASLQPNPPTDLASKKPSSSPAATRLKRVRQEAEAAFLCVCFHCG